MLSMLPIDTENNSAAFLAGVRACVLVAIAGGIFGFAFGILAHLKGLSIGHATLMSALVYAGAAQMVSLTLWNTQHLPIVALMATTFVICLRFLLMAITLRPHFAEIPRWKVYLGLLLLVDENWALTLIRTRQIKVSSTYIFAYFLGVSITFYLAWILGTIFGYIGSHWIHNPKDLGFDFVFTAIFLGLLVGMWRGKKDVVPWFVAAIVAIVAYKFIHGDWYIIIGALVGSLVGAWRDSRK